ncbi:MULTISPECIES: TIM barrel protein [Bacteroidota]|jgi:sugar phosphate isomerase/epimerase|uniref:TIM barrel protein n=2 Tax=Flectobacillus TaxID=101 RepID=A0ABT6Z8H0_9BACT|nr:MULTISPECIES: TIM barrel protein [Bacteroidota]MDI9863630.1 TIM barrel protein [Flectobacillus longus]MDI9877416.1 TIM barrel protein [Flectobacillus rivi]NBB26906.1 TIM barrel protein [Cellulophaga sp. BC115SP]
MLNEQTSRRDFLRTSLLTTAGAALLSNDLFANIKKGEKSHIGVQLWSVREDVSKDPKAALAKIAKMGYKNVEGFGYSNGKFFGLSADEYLKTMNDNGLKMPSAHNMITSKDVVNGQLSDSYKRMLEDAAKVGQKYTIVPYMLDDDRNQGKLMADIFNKAAEYAKTLNLKFGYHNHDFEFKSPNGEMLYTTLLDNTEKHIVFEMDLYWAVVAGQKPADWFNKYKGRFTHVHVKDHDPVKNVSVEVGEGDINFQEIFNKKDVAGIKYFIVELEAYKRTPMEGIEISLNNLKKLKF